MSILYSLIIFITGVLIGFVFDDKAQNSEMPFIILITDILLIGVAIGEWWFGGVK